MQDDPRYQALQLPYLRPSARLDTVALEHVVALFDKGPGTVVVAFPNCARPVFPGPPRPALAPPTPPCAHEMRRRDNYFEEIEQAASPGARRRRLQRPRSGTRGQPDRRGQVLRVHRRPGCKICHPPPGRSATSGTGSSTSPSATPSGGMRSSRSVVAQTLGHFALGHKDPVDFEGYVRQRVEANYFAARPARPRGGGRSGSRRRQSSRGHLGRGPQRDVLHLLRDGAHRLTNLITRHFGIRVHFQRSDPEGVLWKAYENDGVLLPSDTDGTVEGQRLCRWWSSRRTFESEDSYALHYQYTETVTGTFWCVTHVDLERNDGDAVTVGTTEAAAHWFRGSDTTLRAVSTCPDPSCCRRPAPDAVARWAKMAWPSARDHSHFVSGLPTDTVVFRSAPRGGPHRRLRFLDRHSEEPARTLTRRLAGSNVCS